MLQGARQRLTVGSNQVDADSGVDGGADVETTVDMPFDDD